MKGDNKHRVRHRKGQPPLRRAKTSIRVHLENCIYGILIDMTEGREQEFVSIRKLDIEYRFGVAHGINLTERQISYLLDTLAKKRIIEREIHSRDRSAKSWKDQITKYKVVNRSWSFR